MLFAPQRSAAQQDHAYVSCVICIQEMYICYIQSPSFSILRLSISISTSIPSLSPSPTDLILFARIKSLPQKFVRRPRVGFLKTLYKFYAFMSPLSDSLTYISFIFGCYACGFLLFCAMVLLLFLLLSLLNAWLTARHQNQLREFSLNRNLQCCPDSVLNVLWLAFEINYGLRPGGGLKRVISATYNW